MIVLILALVALLTVVLTRHRHAMGSDVHPAVADNEKMLIGADSLIVGDSNPGTDPVGRKSLAATPWRRAMGLPPLRQSSIGPAPVCQIVPQENRS